MSLFKYMTSEIGQIVLEKQQIRFTQPIAFNDPFDVYPRIAEIISDEKLKELILIMLSNEELVDQLYKQAIEQELKKMDPSLKLLFSDMPIRELLTAYISENFGSLENFLITMIPTDKFREYLVANYLHTMSNSFAILSLSMISDNMLMWSHYANCHKGIILVLDDKNPFLQQFENVAFNKQIEISYVSKRPELIIEKFEYTLDEAMEMARRIIFTKSKEWEYEKEFRVIRPLNSAIKLDYLDNNGFEIFV